ncbi:MAG: hypothetical protein JW923_04335 [Spirochaetales bacterium]|nr:hypothetical protein [Spirochaetales bacterium]
MKAAVRYHSLTGNTKKVALALAEGAGCQAAELSAGAADADLLFVGAASYATHGHSVPPEVRRFIASLDPRSVRRAAVFSTGFRQSDTVGTLRRLLSERGIAVEKESFFCKGRLAIFQMRHPDADDLGRARDFGRRLVGN